MRPSSDLVNEPAPRARKDDAVQDVFEQLFGADDDLNAAKAHNSARTVDVQKSIKAVGNAKAKPERSNAKSATGRSKLRPGHLRFIAELLKDPSNQGAAYQKAYPKAGYRRAIERASRLLKRPDVAAEMSRRQGQIATKAVLTRAKLEQALGEVFAFDFRRFYYPRLQEDSTPHPLAGEPKNPCDLDEEAARVIESYEKFVGKYGAKVKFRSTPRLGAAELLAKLKGWVKDDGRPPIKANFNFNFGPKPGTPEFKVVEAVPAQLYGPMGLRAEGERARPFPKEFDENGDPVKSTLPSGYEPGRGVRIKSRGTELAGDPPEGEAAHRD